MSAERGLNASTLSVDIDAITLEVVVEAFLSVVREMRVTVIRTAYSSVVCQGHDFSCGLFDPEGQLVAQSEDLPMHVLPMSWSIRFVMERFGEEIRPGDVYLVNDPTYGGTHLNDVMVAMPVFTGEELFLFPAVRAHWLDVGGMVPGSLSGAAREIYQEGIVIPPIRVYDEGRPNDAALDLLFANCRLSEDRKGDFRACLSACKQAERRIHELIGRYGAKTLSICIQHSLNRAEERTREQIATIPSGEYFYEDYLEAFDRGKFVPIRCCVCLAIHGRSITADFTGTAPQVAHPINCSIAVTASGVFIPIKTILDPDYPVNHGSFRPVDVIVPEGTIFNATPPAPVGGCCEVEKRATGLVVAALAQAIPDRVPADHGLGWKLDGVEMSLEPIVAQSPIETEYVRVKPGQVAGIDQTAVGRKDDQELIRLHIVMSVAGIEPVDEIRLEGDPPPGLPVRRRDLGGPGNRCPSCGWSQACRKVSPCASQSFRRASLPLVKPRGAKAGREPASLAPLLP